MAGNDLSTVALLHMDGTSGATSFPNSAVGGNGQFSASGGAQVDTAVKQFGTGSLNLAYSTSGYLEAPDRDDWKLWANSCIDFWIKTDIDCGAIIGYGGGDWTTGANRGWGISIETNIKFKTINDSGDEFELIIGAPTDLQQHIAVAMTATTIHAFLDGVHVDQVAFTGSIRTHTSPTLRVGFLGSTYCDFDYIDTNIDELRITNGSDCINDPNDPLYILSGDPTDGFTPPAAAYSLGVDQFNSVMRGSFFAPEDYNSVMRGSFRGPTDYDSVMRGLARVEDDSLERYELFVGVNAEPDFDAAPAETFTTLPHVTPPLAPDNTYNLALRKRNKWGLVSKNIITTEIIIDAAGDEELAPPDAPTSFSLLAQAAGLIRVTSVYNYGGDPNPADKWLIYSKVGSAPDPLIDVPLVFSMVKYNNTRNLIENIGPFSNNDEVYVLVRTRRSLPLADSVNDQSVSETAIAVGPLSPVASVNISEVAKLRG